MNIDDLKEKPIWQMAGEEFLYLQQSGVVVASVPNPVIDSTIKKHVYGIVGIARLFGCSMPTANRIKKSGKIDKAITQIGRKIIEYSKTRYWVRKIESRVELVRIMPRWSEEDKVNFTKKQLMYDIKNISIRQFLAEQGIFPRQERTGYGMYLSPFRAETAPSFKVDYGKNLWYDFGTGDGGSIIDLVMKLNGCTVSEAMSKLENGNSFSFHRTEPAEPARSTLQIVSVQPLENRHLMNYLQLKRSINIDIAREYCHEVHYTTNGKPFFAIGFQSDAGGWELRNEYFKGSSSPKSPTTIGNGSSTCLLFEGFMDMLSYLTLKNAHRPTVDMAVLNSVHNLHRAEDFLKQHQTIHCFLDNDESGKRAFAAVEKLGRETIDQSPFYGNSKDLNEYLVESMKKQVLIPTRESVSTPIHKSNYTQKTKSRKI